MQLITKEFSIIPYVHSDTADKRGYFEQYSPPMDVKTNLKLLHENLIAHVIEKLPIGYNIYAKCGYRCERLNNDKEIKGVSNSDHLFGKAVDLVCKNEKGITCNDVVYNILLTLQEDYEQIISEKGESTKNPKWWHFAYDIKTNKRQFLRR